MTATIGALGTSVRIGAIRPGNRTDRDVGDVSALAASIAADGLQHPVVLTTSDCLVSGSRRLAACRLLGWSQIPAVPVTGIWEALEFMEAELADPRHVEPLAKPLSVAEAMSLHGALTDLQWWPRKTPVPRGTGPQAPATTGRRDRIAAVLGLNTYYGEAREMWEAAQGYKQTMGKRHPVSAEDQARAAEAFATIRSRRDIGYAYARYHGRPDPSQRMKDARRAAATAETPRVNGRRPPVRTQARAIEAALDTMHGVITGLCGTGELDPAIPADVTARWEDETTRAIRALTSFRKTLKEHQAHASHGNR